MRVLVGFVVALFGASLIAQEARVIKLNPVIALEADVRWNTLKQAQKDWDEFQERVRKEYTVVSSTDKDAGSVTIWDGKGSNFTCIGGSGNGIGVPVPCPGVTYPPSNSYRRGWESGFTFSSDFNYIVPAPAPQTGFHGSSVLAWPTCSGSVQYN